MKRSYYVTRTVFRIIVANSSEEALEKAKASNYDEWSFTLCDTEYDIILSKRIPTEESDEDR